MKKRILGLALCAAMLLSMLPAPVFADAAADVTGSSGTVSYVISDTDADGTLDTITYSGTGTLTSSAGQSVLISRPSVTHVVVESGITALGVNAFRSCSDITDISLPNTIGSIGDYAFLEDSKLTSFVFPDSVTTIGTAVLKYCSSLTSVTLPGSLTAISSNLFFGCTKLPSVTIPDSVRQIGSYAFNECRAISGIVIPEGVTTLETYTFYNCTALTSISLPSTLLSIGDNTFRNAGLVSIDFPDSLTQIGNEAFEDCSSLQQVNFGSSIQTIGSLAFNRCSRIQELYLPDSVTSIGSNAFYQVQNLLYNGEPLESKWGAVNRAQVYRLIYNATTATSGSVPSTQGVSVGSGVLTVAGNTGNLQKTGYTFIGWNTASDGNGTAYAPGDPITLTGDTTLYAQWQLCSTTITLDGGYADSTNGSVSITYGNSAFDTPGDFTAHSRNDYTLLGYYTSVGGDTRVLYPDGSLVSGVSGYTDADGHWCYEGGTLTLYAHWINNQSFEITIPATLSIGESGTGDFALTCHSINGCTVTVTVASAGNWTLQSAVNTPLPYSLSTANNTVLTNGGTAAVFSAAGSVQLHAAITGDAPTYADSFSDTLTFTCSVSAS